MTDSSTVGIQPRPVPGPVRLKAVPLIGPSPRHDTAEPRTVTDAHILLVEGDVNDEKIISGALGESGLPNRVVVTHNGAEALDYLFARGTYAGRDAGDLPMLVLLDLALARVTGIGVLRAIRANPRTRHLRVIILTASARRGDVVDAYANGATSYVVKPWDSTEFAETVGLLGRYWALTNHAPLT
jgi:CheY-like chemotaxis protein